MTAKKFNHLGQEKSPYLLQHKDNPVHWYPWGDEAFRAAREEGKPIFLSIGYSTCYWCHVMEKDSFEIQEVAEALNRDFISIKVDREEHPDVDQIYMDAVVGMTGRGGWPMSVFLTPDLKPFFGGTFFPKDQFLSLLDRIQKTWKEDPEKVRASGEQVFQFLQRHPEAEGEAKVSLDLLRAATHQLKESFDETYGGFGMPPKFPHSLSLSLLLRIHQQTGSSEALQMVTKTLDEMAQGGMYDQLGGGFHRYSTDERWLVPHFEKMLYDNALLSWTYLEASQLTKNDRYKEVAQETLDYALREMTSPEGGFYSAEDAGEVGKEGEYYVWNEGEIKKGLSSEEFGAVTRLYGVTPSGNFEHGQNILHIASGQRWEGKNSPLIRKARERLFQIREKRLPPHKDDKILTSWNGLMIASMAKGYQVLGDPKYLQAAQKAARFIQKNLTKGGHAGPPLLLRRYRDGDARFEGTLDDYAFLLYGLLNLYESDFDPRWIEWGRELQGLQDKLFWDEKEGGYFFSAGEGTSPLPVRKKELNDGALPSGNAISALNLLRLFGLTFDMEYQKKADSLLKSLAGAAVRYPSGCSQTLIAVDYRLDRSKEIAVIGRAADPSTKAFQKFLYENFIPNKVVAIGDPSVGAIHELPLLKDKTMIDGKTTIYVCENQTCKRPTTDLNEAKKFVEDFEKFPL